MEDSVALLMEEYIRINKLHAKGRYMDKTLYGKNPEYVENIGVKDNPHVLCRDYGLQAIMFTTFNVGVKVSANMI